MNEAILKTLMKLFAILASVSEKGESRNERGIIYEYLHRLFSDDLVEQYLRYFDQYLIIYHPEPDNTPHFKKDEHDIIQNINKLCDVMNEELEQEQKMIILVHLIDFLNRGETLSPSEEHIMLGIAERLHVSKSEYHDIREFTFGRYENVKHPENLLVVENMKSLNPKVKYLFIEKIKGKIYVLRIRSTSTFFFRYHGDEQLFMNGHLLNANRSYIWSFGSVIKNQKFGSIYYVWIVGKFIQETNKTKFVYTAEDIEYRYGQSDQGIKRFTFTEESGRLIGIIGGSGSGKSTLLKLLNGNIKPQHGNITINGFDLHEDKEKLKGIIGYVPQEEMLIKELTVFQNLYYNAKLCFNDYSEEKIVEVVEDALLNFDLIEARDLQVGTTTHTVLSGGQRKRLNIALELMREPAILFVDEPTSGLSSMDSEKVMIMLKRQTFKSKLIISIIHQPSSDIFKLFDKLLVIDQGGRVAYYGNPLDTINYFKRANNYVDAEESECLTCGNINSEQILRNVEIRVVDVDGRLTRKRKTSPQEWYEKYMHHIDPIIKNIKRPFKREIPKTNFKPPKRSRQYKIFFIRDMLAKLSNKQYLWLTLLEAPILAIILAFFTKSSRNELSELTNYVFQDNLNVPAYLFMSVIVALFLGLVISAEEIFRDRKILEREKFLNLSRGSYLFSKATLMFILSAIQMLLFVLIGNYILEIKGMTLSYFLILFTTASCANLIGLNISSGFNSVVTIYILIPLILVPQLLFSGVVIQFDNINNRIKAEKNVPLIGDMMISRWSYEAMAVNQFKNNRFEKHFFDVEMDLNHTVFKRSYVIPELINRLEKIKRNIDKPDYFENNTGNIQLLRKEFAKISNETNFLNPLNSKRVETKSFIEQFYKPANDFLNNAERTYRQEYIEAVRKKEKLYDNIVSESGNKVDFVDLKKKYYNKQLANIMLNAADVREFTVINNEIVKTKDLVFTPPLSNHGRAHFYAPYKKLGSVKIDTVWFNIAFIWLITIVLFTLLYFDVLKKIITYVERLKLQRINNRIMVMLKQVEMIRFERK